MSGGYFDYNQYRLQEMIHKLERREERIRQLDDDAYDFLTEDLIQDAKVIALLAQIFLQRVDWLLSGDDGPETFKERIKEDLKYHGILSYSYNTRKVTGEKKYSFIKKINQ